MDEINQIQNPNVPSGLPGLPAQTGQMPPIPQIPARKKNYLFLVTIVVLVAVGGFVWWYIGQMNNEPVVVNQPEVKINQDVREDNEINKELGGVDTGNLDAEFQGVDSDLNSL